ncbi:hypothetical protein HKX48_008690 [Thoreauomyces humboldtii]|nr:hypothetical protein HKX48_008690 [Thoreauomyces humboldtii]
MSISHPGKNPMVLVSRYVLKLVLSEDLIMEDLLQAVAGHADFLMEAVESLCAQKAETADYYDQAVICQLSGELGEYYFAADDFPTAQQCFRNAGKVLASLGDAVSTEPFCIMKPKRMMSCLQACSAERAVTSNDIEAPELTDRSKAVAAVMRCRGSSEYDAPGLEDIFLWDADQHSLPPELKLIVVEEAYMKGFRGAAAKLGVCIGLAKQGTADAMVDEVPAVSILVWKTFQEASELFGWLQELLHKVIKPAHGTTVGGSAETRHARFAAFAAQLCRRVDKPGIWIAVSRFVSTPAFQEHVRGIQAKLEAQKKLGERKPAPLAVPDVEIHLRLRLLSVLTDVDIEYLRTTLPGITKLKFISTLLEHCQAAQAEGGYLHAERLLMMASQLCLDDPEQYARLTPAEQAYINTSGVWVDQMKSIVLPAGDGAAEAVPIIKNLVMKALETLYKGLGVNQNLPGNDYFVQLYCTLIQLGDEGLDKYLGILAEKMLDKSKEGVFRSADMLRANMLYILTTMVARCMTLFQIWTLPPGCIETELLVRIATQAPEKIAETKDAAMGLAVFLGDAGPPAVSAREYLLKILRKVGQLSKLKVVGSLLAGTVRHLQKDDRMARIPILGVLSHVTNREAVNRPIDPTIAALIPLIQSVRMISSPQLLRPEMGPAVLEFLRGLWVLRLSYEPNEKDVYFALGDLHSAQGRFPEGLRMYLDGMAVRSSNFATPILVHTDNLSDVMPRVSRCAALCKDYLTAIVLAQLCNPPLQARYEYLVKALDDQVAAGNHEGEHAVSDLFLADRPAPFGVLCPIWDQDLLEHVVGYFKRKGDLDTMQLVIRVIARQELAPAEAPRSHDSYVSMVLSRHLRFARQAAIARADRLD